MAILEELLDRGINKNLVNRDDDHVLLLACKLGYPDMVAKLIEYGVDVNWKNR